MKKSKFTESQIVFALKQAESGTTVAEVCRKLGISEATFYGWKKKYRFFEDRTVASVSTPTKDVQEALDKFAAGRLEYGAKGTYRVTGTTLECSFPATDWNGKAWPAIWKGTIGPNTYHCV